MLLNIITANMMNYISLRHSWYFLYFHINPGCGRSLRLMFSLCRQKKGILIKIPAYMH